MLWIVALPIGNRKDISQRALEKLAAAEILLSEEEAVGDYWLKQAGSKAELWVYNEHNDEKDLEKIVQACQHKQVALISDTGTPVFADPGQKILARLLPLEKKLWQATNSVRPVPGASSLMAALSICPFALESFYFVGFLPRQAEERRKKIAAAAKIGSPLCIMDTPYRLPAVLEDLLAILPKTAPVFLCFELTTPSEKVFYAPLELMVKSFAAESLRKAMKNQRWIMLIDRF